MNNLNRSLPRRTFLRGLGATMALPLLAAAAVAQAPAPAANPIKPTFQEIGQTHDGGRTFSAAIASRWSVA